MEDKLYAVIDTNVIVSAVESFNSVKIWHLFCNQFARSLQSAWGIYHRKDSAFSAVAAFAAAAFVFFQESAGSIHNEGKHREAHEQSRQVEPVGEEGANPGDKALEEYQHQGRFSSKLAPYRWNGSDARGVEQAEREQRHCGVCCEQGRATEHLQRGNDALLGKEAGNQGGYHSTVAETDRGEKWLFSV